MGRFFHFLQKGALKCQGKYCGQKCKGDACALFCGYNRPLNSDHCGQLCTGEDCARLCYGSHCGENCTGVQCAIDCVGEYCGKYCLGDSCAEHCSGTECGFGHKSHTLPCNQYTLQWHCESKYIHGDCIWNGTTCDDIEYCNPVMNNSNIKEAIHYYAANPIDGIIAYCEISTWNTTAVTDMSELFYQDGRSINANHNISRWDVS